MRALVLLVLSVSGSIIGQAIADEPVKDLDRLKGKWKVTSSEFEGKDATFTYRRTFMVIEGDELYFTDGFAQSKKTKFKLDTNSDPKSIDLDPDGRIGKGIYSIDKDLLKLCLNSTPGGERPKEFKTKTGDKTNLFTLEREKP